MTIEKINMAVPVGHDTDSPGHSDPAAVEVADEAAELNTLIRGLLQAIHKREKVKLSEEARLLARNQFDVEIKGIVKRFVSNIASIVPDRQGRADIRVRMYADIMTAVKAASDDLTIRRAQRRTLHRWLSSAVGCILTMLVLVIAVLLYPHVAVGS